MSYLIHTHKLNIGYNHQIIQKDIDFGIKSGKIVSLLGKNGVGKTTFIKTIAGFLPKIKGEIFFEGKNLSTFKLNDIAKKISVVLTEKPANLNLKVDEMLAIGRYPYSNTFGMLSNVDKNSIDLAIENTNICHLIDYKLSELSDGQLQKVMIARALTQDTPLIILDEPTTHLDLENKIEIFKLLKKIACLGKGIIMATHDLHIATQLSDELWIFNKNNEIIYGLPEALLLNGELEKSLLSEKKQYDFISNSFLINSQKLQNIDLDGYDEKAIFWTKKMLQRTNLNDFNKKIHIDCRANDWVLHIDNEAFEFKKMEELLLKLMDIKMDIKKES